MFKNVTIQSKNVIKILVITDLVKYCEEYSNLQVASIIHEHESKMASVEAFSFQINGTILHVLGY